MRAVLIADLLSLHRPADQVRQLAVGLVAALVGGVGSNGRGFRHTPGARAGIELTLETAKELRAPLDRAIAAAEFEEAEFRGKGRRAQSRSSSVTPATSAAGFSAARTVLDSITERSHRKGQVFPLPTRDA